MSGAFLRVSRSAAIRMDSSHVDSTTLLAMQMQSTVRWCVRDEETSEVKDCAERSVALPREQRVDGIERRKKKKKEGEEEGPAFSEIIVLAISVSRRQRTRFICRVYCR